MLWEFCTVRGDLLWLRYDESVYYNWFYANVTGTIDLFLVGMIGERMMLFLPELSEAKIKKYRKWSLWAVLIVTCLFLGNYKYQRVIYLFMAPPMFAISTTFMMIVFSYKCDTIKSGLAGNRIAAVCNTLAPYTFAFYLWHSLVMIRICRCLTLDSRFGSYSIVACLGFVITCYMAWLMTKMNNCVIKSIKQ